MTESEERAIEALAHIATCPECQQWLESVNVAG